MSVVWNRSDLIQFGVACWEWFGFTTRLETTIVGRLQGESRINRAPSVSDAQNKLRLSQEKNAGQLPIGELVFAGFSVCVCVSHVCGGLCVLSGNPGRPSA